MINTKLIIDIIIYILFIIGISIISEWLCSNSNYKEFYNNGNDILINDLDIDTIFENAKNDIKKQFYKHINSNLNYSTYIPSYEEQIILQQTSDKLDANPGIMSTLDSHASTNETYGQIYNKIDNDEITSQNLYKKYQIIPREINLPEPQKFVLPTKQSYDIDKYRYTMSNLDDKYNQDNYNVKSINNYNVSYSPIKN